MSYLRGWNPLERRNLCCELMLSRCSHNYLFDAGISHSNTLRFKTKAELLEICNHDHVAVEEIIGEMEHIGIELMLSKEEAEATRTEEVIIKTDKEMKLEAEKLYARYGMSLSDAVNIFFKKSLAKNKLPFESLEDIAPFVLSLLCEYTKELDEIMKIRNLGRKPLEDMLRGMSELGLELSKEPTEDDENEEGTSNE